MQQDYKWCWAAGEWDRPKRRTESEDIEARSVNDECDDIRVPILLGESGPPLLKGPLLIRPEYSLHLTVSVPKRRGFSIVAAAPNTDIASRLVNAGDVFIDPQSGHETFYVSASMDAAARLLNDADGAGNRTPPTLALYAERGTIVLETEAPSEVDSLGSTDDEFDLL